MKKPTKRIYSILLTLVMLLGLLPAPAQAGIRDPIIEVPTTLAFTTKPQSGTALKTESYAYTWALNKAADLIVLEIQETNRLTGATNWKQLKTLTGTSGSGALTCPTVSTQISASGLSTYRISAGILGETAADNELAVATFTVTWTDKTSVIIETASATITEPAAGANPDFNIVSADESKYTVTIVDWKHLDGSSYPVLTASDKFVRGEKYQLDMHFVAKPGYEFSDSCGFNVNGVSSVAYHFTDNGYRRCTFDVYEIIDTINVKGVVAPVAGVTPDVSGITSDTDGINVIEIKWRDKGGYAFEGTPFVAGEKYILWLKYETESGYKVADDAEVSFNISDSNIQAKEITHPIIMMTYEVPEASIPTTYTVTVNNGTASPAGPNAAGTEVTVTADAAPAGKIFKEWQIKGLSITASPSNPLSFDMPANNVTLTATYVDEGGLIETASATITVPVAGATPSDCTVVSDEASKYTVTVVKWEHNVPGAITTLAEDDQFIRGEDYRVYVRFAAKPGYEFDSSANYKINGTKVYAPDSTDTSVLRTEFNDVNEIIDNVKIKGVIAPVADAAPDTSGITSDTEGVNITSAEWKDQWGIDSVATFEAGEKYMLYIKYSLNSCYKVDADAGVTFNISDSNITGIELKTGTTKSITMMYQVPVPKTPIGTVTISDLAKPIVGEMPDNGITVSGTGVTFGDDGSYWGRFDSSRFNPDYDDDTAVDSVAFRDGETYMFQLWLYAEDGYEFTEDSKFVFAGTELPALDMTDLSKTGAMVNPEDSTETLIFINMNDVPGDVPAATTLCGSITASGASAIATITVENCAVSKATLLVAQYSGGQMKAVQTLSVTADGTFVPDNPFVHAGGCTYKAFLLDADTYAPLCESVELPLR